MSRRPRGLWTLTLLTAAVADTVSGPSAQGQRALRNHADFVPRLQRQRALLRQESGPGSQPDAEGTSAHQLLPEPLIRVLAAEEEGTSMNVEETEKVINSVEKHVVVPAALAFCAIFVASNFLHMKHISFIPESLVIVAIGALTSWILRALYGQDIIKSSMASFVDTLLLNAVLLPVIIFESGWSLNHRDFVSQLGYIAIFAIFGTLISMFVIAFFMMHPVQALGWPGVRSVRTALTYASLISAVDPVATLATFNHLNVSPLLNVLVFGESVINDAVAIAIFRVLNDDRVMGPEGSPNEDASASITLGVLVNFFGSMALAMALGMVYLLILRFSRLRHSPHFAILFIVVCCFFTYSFAESVCGLSGIITELFCAMFLSAWVRPHLTVEGMMLTSFLMKQLASLADMAVFLFIGVAVVTVTLDGFKWSGCIMLYALVGRACAVFPLGLVCNACKWVVGKYLPAERRHMITGRYLLMMWHAGLRGGIALALCFQIGDWVNLVEGPGMKNILTEATFVLICAFLLTFGGSTQMCLQCLRIPMGALVDPAELLYQEDDQHGFGWRALRWIEENVLLHILVGKAAEETLHMPGGVVARVLNEAHQAEEAPPGSEICAEISARWARGVATAQQGRSDLLGLFGTTDPTHMEDLDDIRRMVSSRNQSGRLEAVLAGMQIHTMIGGGLESEDDLTTDADE